MWKKNEANLGVYQAEMYFYEKLPDGTKGPAIDNGSRWNVYTGTWDCPAENMTETTSQVIFIESYFGIPFYFCPAQNGRQLPWSLDNQFSGDFNETRQFERRVCFIQGG